MLCRTSLLRRMWNQGERHKGQKHQSLWVPTYEYRKPHIAHKPGYAVRKAFWTLGNYPSGLDMPFRWDEFKKEYLVRHVPEELVEWLEAMDPHPAEKTLGASEDLVKALGEIMVPQARSWNTDPLIPNISRITEPLSMLLSQFGSEVKVPARVGRTLMNRHRDELESVAEAYAKTVRAIGSTPHKRWGMELPLSSHRPLLAMPSALEIEASTTLTDAEKRELVGFAELCPDTTYEDEILLIQIHNLVARASVATGENDTAIEFLQRSLPLARDDVRVAKIHNDLATCHVLQGQFSSATVHAQRSVVLCDDPRGYVLWSLARGYEDALDDALVIAARGTEAHPTDPKVRSNLRRLQEAAVGHVETPERLRKVRWHTRRQREKATANVPFMKFGHSTLDPAKSHWPFFFKGRNGPFFRYDARGW